MIFLNDWPSLASELWLTLSPDGTRFFTGCSYPACQRIIRTARDECLCIGSRRTLSGAKNLNNDVLNVLESRGQ